MIRKQEIFFLFFVLLGAITLNILASQVHLASSIIKTLDTAGNIKEQIIYDYPLIQKIFRYGADFLYALAVATLITTLIVRKSEDEAKRRREDELEKLHESITTNVFDSLFKTLIPSELFEAIKAIITSKTIRRDMKWFYEFREDKDGKLVQKHTTRYTLHNVSHNAVENPIKIIIDHNRGETTRLLTAKCIMNNQETMNYSHEQNENPNVQIEYTNNITSYEYIVTIPGGESVELMQVFETSTGKDEIHDEWFTRHPLIDGYMMATYPEDYDFSVFSSMSSELKHEITESNRKTYVLKGGVLPFQGYVYKLEKKKQKDDKPH